MWQYYSHLEYFQLGTLLILITIRAHAGPVLFDQLLPAHLDYDFGCGFVFFLYLVLKYNGYYNGKQKHTSDENIFSFPELPTCECHIK